MRGFVGSVIAISLTPFAVAGDPGTSLVENPGFLDVDSDLVFGDGWSVFGAAAVDFQFFGDSNPGHATLFGDHVQNSGGVFQLGIAGDGDVRYEMTVQLLWESNWDARTRYGLEFYDGSDGVKLGEHLIEIVEDSAVAGTGYRQYDIEALSPSGTAFVRPIVRFDQVASNGSSRACLVDNLQVQQSAGENDACNDADLSEPFGVLDLSDINAFVFGFTTQDQSADIDGNGVFDLADINLFVAAFVQGCP